VRTCIKSILDQHLPESYTIDPFAIKVEDVYQQVHKAYAGAGQSIYGSAA
jgi:hypothetical protein